MIGSPSGDSQRPAVAAARRPRFGVSIVIAPQTSDQTVRASSWSCHTTRVFSGRPPGQYVTTGHPASTSAVPALRFIRVVRLANVRPSGARTAPPSIASQCSSERSTRTHRGYCGSRTGWMPRRIGGSPDRMLLGRQVPRWNAHPGPIRRTMEAASARWSSSLTSRTSFSAMTA